MNLHEYQAKNLLKELGLPILDFIVIADAKEIEEKIHNSGMNQAAVKIQVHAGGRGKAGGVKIAKSKSEIIQACRQLLNMRMVNAQTGSQGVVAQKVLVTPLLNYVKEFYVAAAIDRHQGEAIFMVSPEGGVEIEEIAQSRPEKILIISFGIEGRLHSYQLIELVKFLGWQGKTAEQGKEIFKQLAKAFIQYDASLLEINPLVMTEEGDLYLLDVKMSIDDNALFRQERAHSLEDFSQISPLEARAKQYDLAYVAMDGTIGCMVNGAGLAMATMDIIDHYGGTPANFLDVGGGASQEKVAEGFKIILSDPKVNAILVNIFGGIMDCGVLAAGLLSAAKENKIEVPLVVRMEGTNVEIGRELLSESKLNIVVANELADAAEKVVNLSKKEK